MQSQAIHVHNQARKECLGHCAGIKKNAIAAAAAAAAAAIAL